VGNRIVNTQTFIEDRGKLYCRGCLGENLFSALDLGELPIANELLLSAESKVETFPLHLRICINCGLGQVADVVTPERIFRDYRYLSSMSNTFLKHASDYVTQQLQSITFSSTDWVIEIASNDGYLLKNFLNHNIRVIGVEPAENVAELSRGLGIETISEFFSSELALKLIKENGYPKLVIANNVMAHVPDLMDFIKGLAVLCGPETRISIENPSLSNILLGMQFDTIYHEHYSYLSASSMKYISESNELSLYKVEQIPIHGGSNRYWLRRPDLSSQIDLSVNTLIKCEIEDGLFSQQVWSDYSSKVRVILNDFLAWLQLLNENGNRVYGYGAAAKASTLLNSSRTGSDMIKAIADISIEKQGRFMPSSGIEIIHPKELFDRNPTDILIFPWNIQNEIAKYLRANCDSEVRFWCAIPKMCQVGIK
jgi:hypothetical protein